MDNPVCVCGLPRMHHIFDGFTEGAAPWAVDKQAQEDAERYWRCPARPGATRPECLPHHVAWRPRNVVFFLVWTEKGRHLIEGYRDKVTKVEWKRVDPKVGPKHPLPGAPPKSWTEAYE